MAYDVELVTLPPEQVAVVHGHVSVREIPDFLATAFDETLRAIADQHVAPAGPPFGRFVPTGDVFDVEAGFPTTDALTASGRVVPDQLPGGPAARVVHRGSYEGVAAAYEAATDWVAEHGYEVAAAPWESYLDEPGVADPRTLVLVPCRRR